LISNERSILQPLGATPQYYLDIPLTIILRAYSWTTQYHLRSTVNTTAEPAEIKVALFACYGLGLKLMELRPSHFSS
jgi:hypothetical protein